MADSPKERIAHSLIWSIPISALIVVIGMLSIRGCDGYNKRSQSYVDQGYTELSNGMWVKVGTVQK